MRMGFVSFGFALLLLCRLGKVGNRVVKINKHAVSLVCIAAARSWLRKQAVSSLSQATGGYGVPSEVPRGNLKCCSLLRGECAWGARDGLGWNDGRCI